MYLYILARWINVWRPVRMSVRPFFSWPFRFVPEAEPMEQQPQIGTLQQAGCAACPNQWGIGCKNTIYIYIYIVYSIYVYTGWTWMDWIAMWSSYWSYTKWYHFDVYCFGAFDEFAAGDSQRLTYADLHHPQGLQETGIIRWRKPWSVGLLCAALCTYIYTYVYIYIYDIYIYDIYIYNIYIYMIYIYIYMIYMISIYMIYMISIYIYDIYMYDIYIYIYTYNYDIYMYDIYIYTYNNNYRYYRYIISINPDPSARVPKKPGDHQPGRGGSSHVVAGERRRTRRWQRRSHRGDRSGLAETGETGDFNGGPTLPSDKLT